jgi:plasmid stabilization system protein ParE
MSVYVRPSFYYDVAREELWLLRRAGAETADLWHEALWDTIHFLQKNPFIGRQRGDLEHKNIRSWRVKHFERWLIFYEVRESEDALILYRVVSGTMDLPTVQFD